MDPAVKPRDDVGLGAVKPRDDVGLGAIKPRDDVGLGAVRSRNEVASLNHITPASHLNLICLLQHA